LSAINATAKRSSSSGIQLHGGCPRRRARRGKQQKQTDGRDLRAVLSVRIANTSNRGVTLPLVFLE
jgi:hypothetical protein